MGDVVNFNQYRKERNRTLGRKRAVENRIRHGLGKVERDLPARDRERNDRELDGKRLEPGAKPDDTSRGD